MNSICCCGGQRGQRLLETQQLLSKQQLLLHRRRVAGQLDRVIVVPARIEFEHAALAQPAARAIEERVVQHQKEKTGQVLNALGRALQVNVDLEGGVGEQFVGAVNIALAQQARAAPQFPLHFAPRAIELLRRRLGRRGSVLVRGCHPVSSFFWKTQNRFDSGNGAVTRVTLL
ncbi:hypothetical protein [Burkholderia contaminans]|uniref:hypothetical protein n=1 Tax=Burkholderia contaminans TaxID=488447 RepID=UPI002D7F84C3|nr:hypothetical protein [Burkholderia contaminans]